MGRVAWSGTQLDAVVVMVTVVRWRRGRQRVEVAEAVVVLQVNVGLDAPVRGRGGGGEGVGPAAFSTGELGQVALLLQSAMTNHRKHIRNVYVPLTSQGNWIQSIVTGHEL